MSPIQRGRGRQRTGPRGDVPDHSHPEYLNIMGHDQELHQTFHILDAAIKTAKIDDAAISTAKIADLAVETLKIADLNVTVGKINEPVGYDVVEANDASVTWPSTQSDILTANITVPSWAGEAMVSAYAQGVGQLNSGTGDILQLKAVAAGVEGQLTADSMGRDTFNNWASGTGVIATTVAAPGSTITVKIRGNVVAGETVDGWCQLVGTAAFKR